MKNYIPDLAGFFNNTNIIILKYGNSINLITAIIILIASILLFFWGYKIKKLALLIIGFIIGSFLGLVIADFFNVTKNNEIILLFIFGFLFSIIIYFLYFATIAVFGLSIGGYLGSLFSNFIKSEALISIIIIVCCAIIFAYLLSKIDKIAFIFLTVFIAFILLRISLAGFNILKNKTVELVISLIFVLSGITFQIYDNYDFHPPEPRPRNENV